MPDTASYATQAIRYNTVTVQVNGAKVGTEYHAAWSPDVVLGGGDSLPYTMDEVQDIIKTCSDPILVMPDNGTTNKLVYTSLPASTRVQCGTDVATNTRPYITLQNATAPTEATVTATVTRIPSGHYTDGTMPLRPTTAGKNNTFTVAQYLKVNGGPTGGARYIGNTFIVKGQPKFPFATAGADGHLIGSVGVVPSVGVEKSVITGQAAEYRVDTGNAGLIYFMYVPHVHGYFLAGDVELLYAGTYDSTADGAHAASVIETLDASVTVTPGADSPQSGSHGYVFTDLSHLSDCDPSVLDYLASDPAQSAYTCVALRSLGRLTGVHRKITADDLFGSATHPALSGEWVFYMDVQ
ncbi:hypothetical protein AH862_24230 [Salmonella enterica subsp. enterica serovar Minnesota]|nr:hypothetical protein [Salmonella enterica subsp. enterica serovar Minnesota]